MFNCCRYIKGDVKVWDIENEEDFVFQFLNILFIINEEVEEGIIINYVIMVLIFTK